MELALSINTSTAYNVYKAKLLDIAQLAQQGIVFCDSRVFELYAQQLGLDYTRTFVCKGEQDKSLDALEQALCFLSKLGCDKNTQLIAIGGGATCDFCGFVASVFMRGISYINVPTTLLCMVDACIGGKTALNVQTHKNLIGTFFQPHAVYVAQEFLHTLPAIQMQSGYAELLKTSMIDANLWQFLAQKKVQDMTPEYLEKAILLCLQAKAHIVCQDERDKNARHALNFGHTIGHALEQLQDYALPHGLYVQKGMQIELAMFFKHIEPQFYEQAQKAIGAPKVQLGDIDKVLRACKRDKKNKQGDICFAIPTNAGQVEIFYLQEKQAYLALKEAEEICK